MVEATQWADRGQILQPELAEPGQAGCIAAHVEGNFAPRIDDEAVAVSPPSIGMLANLCG